ncbi:MAG: urea transport system permease protein [Candidatus Binatota bacterium]|jgi:urea transport system permease protein|nr:urea transport system permease protein [Candidatus Binatota bacterium]
MDPTLPVWARLHARREWVVFAGVAFVTLVLVPALAALPSEGSPIRLPGHLIPLFGKFACYAIVALAVDLIWGYAGILSLGHGVFFALGGYAMGMYLMRSIGAEGVYRSELPDFMVFLDWKELPITWWGFQHFAYAASMALVIPGGLALAFGWFAFRSRIRGVYFSIITQALTYALMLLFFRNDTGFGGNNGLTDFKRILGFPIHDPSTRIGLYVVSVAALLGAYLLCRYLVVSRLGRVLAAIRDAESRVMFCGYDPAAYKLFFWTVSAMLCGLAGALYTPQVGIINPSELQPANSVEMAIWVAVGGRGTLFGAALGAVAVNWAKSWLTVAFPDLWLYLLGALFIAVTLFFPEGFAGLARWKRS